LSPHSFPTRRSSDLKEANVEIDVRNVDDIESYLEDKDQWDATMYSFGTIPRGDTGYFFNQAYQVDGAINKGDYENDKVVELIDELNETVGQDERADVANEIVVESVKYLQNNYITYNDQIAGLSEKVENFVVSLEVIYLLHYQVYLSELRSSFLYVDDRCLDV